MRLVALLACLTLPLCGSVLDHFLKEKSLQSASVGIHICDLSGRELLSHQAHLALIPASTMKLVTTATALELLGPDFTFKTQLYLLDGDLIIKGGGDPTLSASSPTAEFSGWLAAIKKAGVNEIRDIIADPSRFEEQTIPNNWPWGDIGNYYGAGPSGLNFHKNTYRVTFLPGKVGSPAKLLAYSPRPPGVHFINHMRTGPKGSGDQGYIYCAPRGAHVTLRGTIPAGGNFTIKGALPDPPLLCATSFRNDLEKNGVRVTGTARVASPSLAKAKRIHEQLSPPLSKIIHGTNHRSVNLYADSIFKILIPQGSTKSAVNRIRKHWSAKGIDLTGFVMEDGSGLSPRNTLTSRQLAEITRLTLVGPQAEVFRASLPIAGQSGTLVHFGKGSAIKGKVRAKSGTLTRVTSYAGMLTTSSGKEHIFAIITNNTVSSPRPAIVRLLSAAIKETF